MRHGTLIDEIGGAALAGAVIGGAIAAIFGLPRLVATLRRVHRVRSGKLSPSHPDHPDHLRWSNREGPYAER
jgi:hypothetical protein